MSFDAAFERTVGLEGGYSNNSADKGGETMWGITAAVARAHGYLGPMKDMPVLAAKDIYRQSYWLLIHLDLVDPISQAISAEMFDAAVNLGAGVPVPFLQRALNVFNRQGNDYPDMLVDGLCGVQTASALKNFLAVRGARGEPVMLAVLRSFRGVRYVEIAEKNPSQEIFEFGWWNRIVGAA